MAWAAALRVVGVVAVLVTVVLAVANCRLAQAEQLRARGVLMDVVVVAIDVHSGGRDASITENKIGPGDGSELAGELSGGPYTVGDRLTAYVDPLGKVDPAQPRSRKGACSGRSCGCCWSSMSSRWRRSPGPDPDP